MRGQRGDGGINCSTDGGKHYSEHQVASRKHGPLERRRELQAIDVRELPRQKGALGGDEGRLYNRYKKTSTICVRGTAHLAASAFESDPHVMMVRSRLSLQRRV